MYANVTRKDGTTVSRGSRVDDFRGFPWTFIEVAALPVPGKSAKVRVMNDEGTERVFYAEVFDLTVVQRLDKNETVGRIIAFENGELNDDEVIQLFQDLVDSGVAWQLQGYYGRTARHLIDAGMVVENTQERGTDNGHHTQAEA